MDHLRRNIEVEGESVTWKSIGSAVCDGYETFVEQTTNTDTKAIVSSLNGKDLNRFPEGLVVSANFKATFTENVKTNDYVIYAGSDYRVTNVIDLKHRGDIIGHEVLMQMI